MSGGVNQVQLWNSGAWFVYNTSTTATTPLIDTLGNVCAQIFTFTSPPNHAADPGQVGQMAYDGTYFYIYTGGSWGRLGPVYTGF
jgi:hypothetical protein